MRPGKIELRIEELVLHGFEPGDRHRVGEAVERELGRLFAERGAPPSLTRSEEVPRVDGGSFELTPGSGAGMIGTQVAQTVYRGLGA